MTKLDYRGYIKQTPRMILRKYPRELLSDREYKILVLRNEGLTYQKIGNELGGYTKQRIEQIMNDIAIKYLEHFNMNSEVNLKKKG